MFDKNKIQKTVIKSIISLILTVVIFYIIFREMKNTNWNQVIEALSDLSLNRIILLFVFSVLAFSVAASYDFILARNASKKLRKKDIFMAGWVGQSFGNLIGLGGAASAVVRNNIYRRLGLEREERYKIFINAGTSSIVGGFLLALPLTFFVRDIKGISIIPIIILSLGFTFVYFFSSKIKLKNGKEKYVPILNVPTGIKSSIIICSMVDWLAAGLFFAFILNSYNLHINPMISLSAFIFAYVIGLLGMTPGGIGTFEGIILLILTKYTQQSEIIIVSLLIFRIFYTILPFVIGSFMYIYQMKFNKIAKSTTKIN